LSGAAEPREAPCNHRRRGCATALLLPKSTLPLVARRPERERLDELTIELPHRHRAVEAPAGLAAFRVHHAHRCDR